MAESDTGYVYECPQCKMCSFHAGPINVDCPHCGYVPNRLGVIYEATQHINEYAREQEKKRQRYAQLDDRYRPKHR